MAYNPTWENIANHPVYLNQLEEDDNSRHVSRNLKNQLDEIVSFYKGETDYSDAAHNTSDITGSWNRDATNLLRLKNNMVFSDNPKLPSRNFPSDTVTNYGKNRILRVDELKKMDEMNITAKSTEIFPEGTVVLWDNSESTIPSGWCLFKELSGKFPVAVNMNNKNKEMYMQGDTGGKEEVSLTESNMPKHTHYITIRYKQRPCYGIGGTNFQEISRPWPVIDWDEEQAEMKETITDAAGEVLLGQPHNNLPPYYAIRFIRKIEGCIATSSTTPTPPSGGQDLDPSSGGVSGGVSGN